MFVPLYMLWSRECSPSSFLFPGILLLSLTVQKVVHVMYCNVMVWECAFCIWGGMRSWVGGFCMVICLTLKPRAALHIPLTSPRELFKLSAILLRDSEPPSVCPSWVSGCCCVPWYIVVHQNLEKKIKAFLIHSSLDAIVSDLPTFRFLRESGN